jgi:hypothetical protein
MNMYQKVRRTLVASPQEGERYISVHQGADGQAICTGKHLSGVRQDDGRVLEGWEVVWQIILYENAEPLVMLYPSEMWMLEWILSFVDSVRRNG